MSKRILYNITTSTSSSFQAQNVSSGTLNLSTGLTAASAQITNENVTTSTIATLRNTNAVSTNVSSGTLNLSTGLTAASAQITNENVTTSTIATLRNTNAVSTNISSGSIVTTSLTTGALYSTNLTSTNVVATNLSSGTVSATTFTGGSLSLSGNLNVAGTLTTVNITSTNLVNTNVSAGVVVASTSLSATGSSNTIGNIFTNSGQVGINTTALSDTLTIRGGLSINRDTASNTTGAFRIIQDGTGAVGGAPIVNYIQSGTQQAVDSRADLRFTSMYNGIAYMTIATTGNVGIGTTSPVGILNVRDTTDFVGDDGGAFYITGGTNGNRRLHMGYVNTGNYGWIEAVEKGVNLTNLSLQQRGGNVGIGTTSPGELLDVSGNIKNTGYNYVSSSTLTTGSAGTVLIATGVNVYSGRILVEAIGGGGHSQLTIDISSTFSEGFSAQIPSVFVRRSQWNNGTNISNITITTNNSDGSYRSNFFLTCASGVQLTIRLLERTQTNLSLTTPALTALTAGYIQTVYPLTGTGILNGAMGNYMNVNTAGIGINNTGGSYTLDVNGTLEASNSNGLMLFASSGNLGIGTTTPQADLHILESTANNANPANIFLDKNSERAAIQVWNYNNNKNNVRIASNTFWNNSGDSVLHNTSTAIGWSIVIGSENDRFTVSRQTGTNAGGDLVTVNSSGNLGIGTNNPVSTLSIFTSNNLAGNIESGQNGLSIQTGTSAASDMILYMGADKTNKVSYIQSVLWGAVTNPLILNPRGGNVGISNTAPTHLLSVGIAPNGANTKGSISINTSGESRYHLFNYGGVAEWLFGQKTFSRSDFTFSKLVAGTETDYLTISTGGSVGIGTTAPARPLHVQGAARLGGSGPALDFGDDFTTQIYRNGTTSEMRFNTNSLERITITSTGNVGIGTISPSYPLHVAGNIYATGNIIAYSDSKLKTNIQPITNALDTVNKLKGVSYTHIETNEDSIGLIAQDTMEVLPQVVATRGNYLGINYGNIVGLLVEAIKEIKLDYDNLKADYDKLKTDLNLN